ncbi:High osmolarity signaling protein SHO1 [Mycena venus]|uniref:High osmolarity signaling protein SHO1 n=1 Tax=Mycena venus TaxID=2733690 RepID=A0A8H6X2I5_9AGAR|nr:High osmolarity signaling protein SHO1 [Mycena venus]
MNSLILRPLTYSVAVPAASSQPVEERTSILARGPGRTLHEIYSSLGSAAETTVNRAAHTFGLGPLAVAARISAYFGEGRGRELKLDELGKSSPRTLRKDCSRLMKYALPSESAGTQMDAFKSIITLTTLYPGLRRLFLNCGYTQNITLSGDTISSLWVRDNCGLEWHFWRHFAAACLADNDFSLLLENSRQWTTCVDDVYDGLSTVERLLVASDCKGPSNFSPFIAIRYLGGILELPSFWLQRGTIYEATINKIAAKTVLFLKDIGVDSSEEEAMWPMDVEGIDTLCTALLKGVKGWMVGCENADIANEFWYDGFLQVILLLRQPKAEDLLPNAWVYATSPEMKRWVPTPFRMEVFTTLVAREPGGPGNGAIPSFVSDRDTHTTTLGLRTSLEGGGVVHRAEHSMPSSLPSRTASGSGGIEALSSEDDGGVFSASVGNSSSKPWHRLRSWYKRLGLGGILGNEQFESEGNHVAPANSIGNRAQLSPPSRDRPLTETSLSDQESVALNEQETLSESRESARASSISPPPPPTNPLPNNLNKSVGWVYLAPEISKNDIGEPLYVWTVDVLVDGAIVGRGIGNSKKAGRRAAVEKALALMDAQSTDPLAPQTSSSVVDSRAVKGTIYLVANSSTVFHPQNANAEQRDGGPSLSRHFFLLSSMKPEQPGPQSYQPSTSSDIEVRYTWKRFRVNPQNVGEDFPFHLELQQDRYSVCFLEFRSFSDPPLDIGNPGDIWLNISPTSYTLFALNVKKEWVRWPGPTLDDKERLIPHPYIPTYALWCTIKQASWYHRDKLESDWTGEKLTARQNLGGHSSANSMLDPAVGVRLVLLWEEKFLPAGAMTPSTATTPPPIGDQLKSAVGQLASSSSSLPKVEEALVVTLSAGIDYLLTERKKLSRALFKAEERAAVAENKLAVASFNLNNPNHYRYPPVSESSTPTPQSSPTFPLRVVQESDGDPYQMDAAPSSPPNNLTPKHLGVLFRPSSPGPSNSKNCRICLALVMYGPEDELSALMSHALETHPNECKIFAGVGVEDESELDAVRREIERE